MTRRPLHRNRSRTLSALGITGGLGAFTATGAILGLAIERLVEAALGPMGWLMALTVIALVGLGAFAVVHASYGRLQRLVRSEARELDQRDLTARPYLITGFSQIGPEVQARLEARLDQGVAPDQIAAICAEDRGGATFGGWQQQLRLIRFLSEKGPLRVVCVIDNGKGKMALFLRLLRAAFPDIRFLTVPEGAEGGVVPLRVDRNYQPKPDYESYDYVSMAFDRAFALIAAESGKPQVEVEAMCYVDITPGLKVFSVAAAIQTLNREAIFLYVTTNSDPEREARRPGGYEVLGYDADARFGLGAGGG